MFTEYIYYYTQMQISASGWSQFKTRVNRLTIITAYVIYTIGRLGGKHMNIFFKFDFTQNDRNRFCSIEKTNFFMFI